MVLLCFTLLLHNATTICADLSQSLTPIQYHSETVLSTHLFLHEACTLSQNHPLVRHNSDPHSYLFPHISHITLIEELKQELKDLGNRLFHFVFKTFKILTRSC